MKKNNRFFISFLISLLLHGLVFGLLVFLKPQQPQKQTQVKLDNLLVLKRGYSQDKSKNTPGARKPSIAAKSIQPSPLITPNQNPLAKASTPPKAQQKKQKDTDKKALDTYNPSSFDARNLSLLDPSPSYMQNSTPQSATQIDKGTDPQTIQEIDKLYGEEFGDLGSAEKDFIRNNLRNIGRITQRYLSYPRLAAYFEQSGVNAVEFTLHPNGDISGLKIIKSSGLSSFDSQTLHTIRIAYKDYPRPSTPTLIRIHVTYSYFGR